MKKLAEFQRVTIEALGFLVSEYGFELADNGVILAEAHVAFRRGKTVVVTEHYELGNEPWMDVWLIDERRSMSLKRLAKESGISWPRPEGDGMRAMVQRDAAVLREWCRVASERW